MPFKVIYLDDEQGLCDNFSDDFATEEIQILTFSDPQEALDEAKRNPPDVAFLDYRLPGTNGDKVAQAMAASIPKYLITGEVDVATTYKFIAVFGKPVKVLEIHRLLDLMVKQRKAAASR